MDCREVRERLPLLVRGDLGDGEKRLVESHLASCEACRPEHREIDDAIETLREGTAHLLADTPGTEEVRAMIGNLEQRRGGKHPGLLAAAAVVLIGAGAAFLFVGNGEDGGRPAPGAFEAALPALRIAIDDDGWVKERLRVECVRMGPAGEIRLFYDPEDGGPKVREESDAGIPGSATGDPPAVRFAIGADEPWSWPLGSTPGESIPFPSVWLAGRRPDGTVGAVPFIVHPPREIDRMGASLTPYDLVKGVDPQAVVELRITRSPEGGVRYRFGLHPLASPDAPRFSGGDVRVSDRGLEGGEGGPAVPGLVDWLTRRFAYGAEKRELVLLSVGTGVRYRDVLRAVECARGSPEVLFIRYPRSAYRDTVLPDVGPEGGGFVVENLDRKARALVNVLADGTVKVRGIQYRPDDVPIGDRPAILLRAHEKAPWSVCLAVVQKARAAGVEIDFAFRPEDPAIHWERVLTVPAVPDGAKVNDVRIPVAPEGDIELIKPEPGDAFRLSVWPTATAGDVYPLVVRYLSAGVVGIEFE